MEHSENRITLRGSLMALPEFSHENHGRRFFRFTLEVPRLSGAVDLLPIVAEHLGVTRQAVSKWENGSSDPSTSNLLALAKLYGIDAADLLREVSPEA